MAAPRFVIGFDGPQRPDCSALDDFARFVAQLHVVEQERAAAELIDRTLRPRLAWAARRPRALRLLRRLRLWTPPNLEVRPWKPDAWQLEFLFRDFIAREVRASRERIRAVDPDAYDGFVTDTACVAVARRLGLRPTTVLRAYRNAKPLPATAYSRFGGLRPIPASARRVSDEAAAVA